MRKLSRFAGAATGPLVAVVATAVVAGAAVAGVQVWPSNDRAQPAAAQTAPKQQRCEGSGAGGWEFEAHVSDDDGLVLGTSSLNGRQFTEQISAPYLWVDLVDKKESYRRTIELTAGGTKLRPDRVGARVDDFECKGSAEGDGDVYVRATFRTGDLLPGSPGGVLTVEQEYRFRAPDPDDPCEPTETVECARFWPKLSYEFDVDGTCMMPRGAICPYLAGFKSAQRMAFAPNGVRDGGVEAFQEKLGGGATGGQGVETMGDGPGTTHSSMKYEAFAEAIEDGEGKRWDSLHISDEEHTSLPGVDLIGHLGAGCGTCIHVHWRWGRVVNVSRLFIWDWWAYKKDPFTDGKVQLEEGSQQDVTFGIVRAERGEEDPDNADWQTLVDDEGTPTSKLSGHPTVFWWEMRSTSAKDTAFPILEKGRLGGDGAIFFRADPEAAEPAHEPAADGAVNATVDLSRCADGVGPDVDPATLSAVTFVDGSAELGSTSAATATWTLDGDVVLITCHSGGPVQTGFAALVGHGPPGPNSGVPIVSATEPLTGYWWVTRDRTRPGEDMLLRQSVTAVGKFDMYWISNELGETQGMAGPSSPVVTVHPIIIDRNGPSTIEPVGLALDFLRDESPTMPAPLDDPGPAFTACQLAQKAMDDVDPGWPNGSWLPLYDIADRVWMRVSPGEPGETWYRTDPEGAPTVQDPGNATQHFVGTLTRLGSGATHCLTPSADRLFGTWSDGDGS